MRKVRQIVVIGMVVFLGACASTPKPTAPYDVPTWPEYENAESDEARTELIKETLATAKLSDEYKSFLYMLGREVCYENGSCVKWTKLARKVSIWYVHSTGSFGIQTSAMNVYDTDVHGNILNNKGAIMAHAADQTGVGRFAISALAKSGVINGSLAAHIAKCDGDECGGATFNIEGGDAASVLDSNTNSSANIMIPMD